MHFSTNRNSAIRIVMSLAIVLTTEISSTAETASSEIKIQKTPDGVEYGCWGKPKGEPAPILIILSGAFKETLSSRYFRQSGNELAELGYLCVSIDIPSHGSQIIEDNPNGLVGWNARASKGDNFVEEFNVRLSNVLDHLIETGVANPEKIAICGTSRGGFLAIHFMAYDARVKCAAAYAPVTDPAMLREFSESIDHPMVKQLSLENQAEKLAGRPVWIVIGDQDERVSTQKAIDLAASITAVSKKLKKDNKVKILVKPEPRGHTTPKGAAAEAAKWIHDQIGG